MSFIASLLDRWFPVRHGKVVCRCGKVEIALATAGSSYAVCEQTAAICHCHDCVGFVRALNGDHLVENNSTLMIQFYRDDLEVVKGSEYIRGLRLRDGTPMIRCYCGCCGTPLGAEGAGIPICLLYYGNLRNYTVFLPSLVVNYSSREPGTREYDRRSIVRMGMMAPVFIWRVLTRVLVGLLFGKWNGGLLTEDQRGKLAVGIESIEHKARRVSE